jgi:hypothetical protein
MVNYEIYFAVLFVNYRKNSRNLKGEVSDDSAFGLNDIFDNFKKSVAILFGKRIFFAVK